MLVTLKSIQRIIYWSPNFFCLFFCYFFFLFFSIKGKKLTPSSAPAKNKWGRLVPSLREGTSLQMGLGVKRVTEPNRTEPTDYTGRSLRKFPIAAVPGFTSVTEPNQQMRYLLAILLLFLLVIKLITQVSRFLFRDACNMQ